MSHILMPHVPKRRGRPRWEQQPVLWGSLLMASALTIAIVINAVSWITL